MKGAGKHAPTAASEIAAEAAGNDAWAVLRRLLCGQVSAT